MQFQFNSTTVNVPSVDIQRVKTVENQITDIKVVTTDKFKNKKRKKISIKKGTDRTRTYALRYYLVNQDNKILNITSPYEKHKDAIKAIKIKKKIIYFL